MDWSQKGTKGAKRYSRLRHFVLKVVSLTQVFFFAFCAFLRQKRIRLNRQMGEGVAEVREALRPFASSRQRFRQAKATLAAQMDRYAPQRSS
jgi:hypothetical protein